MTGTVAEPSGFAVPFETETVTAACALGAKMSATDAYVRAANERAIGTSYLPGESNVTGWTNSGKRADRYSHRHAGVTSSNEQSSIPSRSIKPRTRSSQSAFTSSTRSRP